MIKEDIKSLVELQELDSKIYALQEEKSQKPLMLKGKEEELNGLKEKLSHFLSGQKNIKIEIDKKNLALKEKEDKINKLNIQLNTTRTNKEYSALLNEISGLKADISLLEDEILNLYNKIDDEQGEVTTINRAIERANQELKTIQDQVTSALKQIDQSLAALQKQRAERSARIPAELLSGYEKIINHSPNKTALVCVVDEVCQGCFMDITPQEVNELMKGKEIIRCRSCGRILYL